MATQTIRTYDQNGVLVDSKQVPADDAADNAQILRDRAAQAVAANAAFQAIANPTTAQAVAQVKTLTKECNALIRLALGLLDDTTGT